MNGQEALSGCDICCCLHEIPSDEQGDEKYGCENTNCQRLLSGGRTNRSEKASESADDAGLGAIFEFEYLIAFHWYSPLLLSLMTSSAP